MTRGVTMSYQALYRKYRPHCFEDFIDQDYIKKIIINSLSNNKISHAYLFSGPRGIGKTSMAKIFAKAINCLNFNEKNDVCEKCENCLECDNNSVDIIEIDAASNNGVDQIRELKNKINIVPSKLKYKVYIVDEVHMLSNSAFNALLKTLEEPPSHVIFILATTEFYSVPETIVSRCQCYSFSRITNESLKKRLMYIAEKENIEIEEEVIEEISRYSNGGLRDAIGMLDKLNSFTNNKISMEDFKNINGLIAFEDIMDFYEGIFENNYKIVIDIINKVENSGYDFKNFIERLMLYTRDIIVDNYVNEKKAKYDINQNVHLVQKLNELLNRLKDSVNPLVIVQVYILNYMSNLNIKNLTAENNQNNEKKSEQYSKIISREIKSQENNNLINKINLEDNRKKIDKKLIINEKVKQIRIRNALALANINLKKDLLKKWEFLNENFLDEKFGKIAQLLSDLTPMVVGDKYIILTCSTDGLIDNVYNNLIIAEEFLTNICNRQIKIVIVLDDEFNLIKNKYIEDKKNNIMYNIEEEQESLIIKNDDSLISKAINVFGSDLVEIE